MSADHIGDATNMIAPVAALSSKPVDDTGEASSNVNSPQPDAKADTGELRERVAASIGSAWAHGTHGKPFDVKAETDAILDLIQSERAGSPIGQNDQPGLAFSDAGEP